MVRWHMQILYVTKGLPFANIKDMLKQVPLEEIVFCLCDRLGRGEMEEGMIREEENVKLFAEICNFLSRIDINKTSRMLVINLNTCWFYIL